MKFCCASNAVIKHVKIARKKLTFLQKYFKQNRPFSKSTDFRRNEILFQTLEVLPVIFTTYLPV